VNANAKPGQDSDNSDCSLEQRLTHPETITRAPENYWPARVDLVTKMGYRCPRCDKFLIKPKAGANRTTFDVHCIAMTQLPRVTVGEFAALKKGDAIKFMMYFKNHLDAAIDLRFSEGEAKQQVTLPSGSVSIAAYEEAAEQAEGKASALDSSDDPKVIGYRSLSKVGVFFGLTPQGEQAQVSLMVHLTLRDKKAEGSSSAFSYPLIVDLGPCVP